MLGIGLLLLVVDHAARPAASARCSARPSKFHTTRAEFSLLHSLAHRHGGLLGHRGAQHSRLHPLRQIAKGASLGQALGLPAAMTLYSFIGVAVTSASVVLFGQAIWDPVVLLGAFHQPVVASIALVALLVATLNTNVGGQRRLALQRFFQPQSAPHLLPHRRPDHRRGRRRS